ncbi:ABC transporter ATP-binding protein [Clostridium sp. CTA-7]
MVKDIMIEFKGVSKSYGENIILDNFNLQIQKGEFITIIGTSGCGKTTVLKLINGLIFPNKGEVYIDGKNISNLDQINLRRNIGYVIQGVGLFPHMNIAKNISYVLNLTKTNKIEIEERVKKLIKTVGMEDEVLKRYPGELSGGQRQRIGIARALAAYPDILLMDEPFGAVDEITRKSLQEEILKIHKEFNMTIVFVTHDIKEALKLGTEVIVMDNGEIIQMGTPDKIKNSPKTQFVRDLIGA